MKTALAELSDAGFTLTARYTLPVEHIEAVEKQRSAWHTAALPFATDGIVVRSADELPGENWLPGEGSWVVARKYPLSRRLLKYGIYTSLWAERGKLPLWRGWSQYGWMINRCSGLASGPLAAGKGWISRRAIRSGKRPDRGSPIRQSRLARTDRQNQNLQSRSTILSAVLRFTGMYGAVLCPADVAQF